MTPTTGRYWRWSGVLTLSLLLWAPNAHAWHSLKTSGNCKQTRSQCRSTIGNAGGAGACCDPLQSSTLASCATNNYCDGGQPYKWANLPLNWSLNLNNMPGKSGYAGKTAASIETVVKKAFDTWTIPQCTGFTHKYNGQTTSRNSTGDGKVVVFLASDQDWANLRFPSSALAVTQPVADTRTGALRDADIIVNPKPARRNWGVNPNVASSEMDLLDVTAHEVGHALGFGHTAPRNSLMYFSVRGVGPVYSGLPTDETNGVCTIYPIQSCTSDAQCGGTCRACTNSKCGPRNITTNPTLCKGCKSDADCSGGSCQTIAGQSRCVQDCTGGCCPDGYKCGSLAGKSVCLPNSNSCPKLSCSTNDQCGTGENCQNGSCKKTCTQNSDCGQGSVCTNQTCVEATPGKLGDACSAQLPCDPAFQCYTTSKGSFCSRLCGTSAGATFPDGSQGANCKNGTSCDEGATCARFSTGESICMLRCSSSTTCAKTGGKCISLGSLAACMCRSDSECPSGRGCNMGVFAKVGLRGLGACGPKQASACPTGYACQDPGVGKQLCVPSSGTAVCGNNTCETSENCSSCPQDCPCPTGQLCNAGQCVPSSTGKDCGNGTCDANENCSTCPLDCGCTPNEQCNAGQCVAKTTSCGDNTCDGNETCATCPKDCACPTGQQCNPSGTCEASTDCGNNTCDPSENCQSCPQDCACPTGQQCLQALCQNAGAELPSTKDAGESTSPDATVTKPPGSFGGPCKADGSCDGTGICVTDASKKTICLLPHDPRVKGCGCQSTHGPTPFSLFLLSFAFLFLLLRRRIRP